MEYRTATELIAALDAGKVSSAELVGEAIARIEQADQRLNAVVVRDFDRARSLARDADQARARGERRRLLGIPMTIKECYNVAGLPTTWGLPDAKENIAVEDAVVVSRLKAAGAIILGKTNVSTMLGDWQSANAAYGVTNNPWDIGRTPGGSSGGSAAALAAGFVPLEFGSDLGGSLRAPAHFCGVFAHKPTHGIVPMRGMNPPGAPSLSVSPFIDLAVAGPMARSAADLTLALDVTAGPDDFEAMAFRLDLPPPRHRRLQDHRIMVLDQHPLLPTEQSIRAALAGLADRLEKAGCRVTRQAPSLPDLARIGRAYLELLFAFIGSDIPDADYAAARERADALAADQPIIPRVTSKGMVLSHREWVRADRVRTALKHQWNVFFREWDIVLCPAMPTTAFPHDHRPFPERALMVDGTPVRYGDQILWPSVASLTGQPATTLPIGLSEGRLPIGAQAIGPFLEDRTTIAFAHLVEREFGGFVAPPRSD